jgi:hypothetical protein
VIVFFLSFITLVGNVDLCLRGTIFNGIIFGLLSSLLKGPFRASA